MFNYSNPQSGLIKMIVVIVIGLLILSYLGFNLRTLADSPTTQENFGYVKTVIVDIWNDYLKKPVTYVWQEIFVEKIWNPAFGERIANLEDKADAHNEFIREEERATTQ